MVNIRTFLRKVFRRLFLTGSADENPKFGCRDESREQFYQKVKAFKDKLQIGVRNEKIGPDWIAVDLFDQSKLIDFNYDIQNLPFENESFDCVVCNAVLEHVPYPELALYEFLRILRPGGHIWIEIPFLQAYHSHPKDFWRCTLSGIRLWCRDFKERASGIFEGFGYEAEVIYNIWSTELGIPEKEKDETIKQLKAYIVSAEDTHGKSSRVYMATFFWGEKPEHRKTDEEKRRYMEYLKSRLTNSVPS